MGHILATNVVSLEIPSNESRSPQEPVFGAGVDLKAGLVNRSSHIGCFPTLITQQVTDIHIEPQIYRRIHATFMWFCSGSARCTYVERKADLLASGQFIHSPESSFHQGHMTHFLSPGLARRDTQKKHTSSAAGSKQTGSIRIGYQIWRRGT